MWRKLIAKLNGQQITIVALAAASVALALIVALIGAVP